MRHYLVRKVSWYEEVGLDREYAVNVFLMGHLARRSPTEK